MTPTILSFLFVQELIKCKFSLFVFINLITQMNESSSKCRSIRLTDFSCCCYFQCEREREKNKDNMCNSNRIIAIASIVHSMRYEELIFSALNLNNTFLQHKIVVDAHFLFFARGENETCQVGENKRLQCILIITRFQQLFMSIKVK